MQPSKIGRMSPEVEAAIRILGSLEAAARPGWKACDAAEVLRLLRQVCRVDVLTDGDVLARNDGLCSAVVAALSAVSKDMFGSSEDSRDLDRATELWLKICLTASEAHQGLCGALGSAILTGAGASFIDAFRLRALSGKKAVKRCLALEIQGSPETLILRAELIAALLEDVRCFKEFCADHKNLKPRYRIFIDFAVKSAETSPPAFHEILGMMLKHSQLFNDLKTPTNPVLDALGEWCNDVGKGESGVVSAFHTASVFNHGQKHVAALEVAMLTQAGVSSSRPGLLSVSFGAALQWTVRSLTAVQTKRVLSFMREATGDDDEEAYVHVNLAGLSLSASDEWTVGSCSVSCRVKHGHRLWAGGSKVATFCFATSTEAADLVEVLLTQEEAGPRESKVGVMGDIDEEDEGAGEEEEPKGGWWDIQIPQLRKECLERDIEDQGDKPALIRRLMEHDSDLIQMLTDEQALSDEEKQSRVDKRGSRVTPIIAPQQSRVGSHGSGRSGRKHATKKQLFPADGCGREDMGGYSAQKLRVECKARGVSTSGSKTQMLDRIEDHDTALVVSFAPDGLDADGDNATDPFDYDAGDDGCGENDHADDFSAPDNDDHQDRGGDQMGSSILQSKAKKTVSPTARSSLPAREPEPVPKRSSLPDRMDHAKNATMAATPSRSSLGPSGPDDHTLRPRASTLSKSIGKKSHSVELVSKKDSVCVSGERGSVPLSGRKRPVASSRPHTWTTNMGAASSASSAGSSSKTLGTVQPSRGDVSVVVDEGGGNDGRLTVLSEASAEGGAEVPERRGRDSDLSGKATVENSLEKSHDDVTTKMSGSSNVHASQANADEPGDFHDDFSSSSPQFSPVHERYSRGGDFDSGLSSPVSSGVVTPSAGGYHLWYPAATGYPVQGLQAPVALHYHQLQPASLPIVMEQNNRLQPASSSSSSSFPFPVMMQPLIPHIREPRYVAGHVQGAVSRIMQRKRGEVAEIARSSSCAMDKELDRATLMFTVEVARANRDTKNDLAESKREIDGILQKHKEKYESYKMAMQEINKRGKTLAEAVLRIKNKSRERKKRISVDMRARGTRTREACRQKVRDLAGLLGKSALAKESPGDKQELGKLLEDLFSP